MKTIKQSEPLAHTAVAAIHKGDVSVLKQLLYEHPALATVRIVADPSLCQSGGTSRTLLHVATDWPGHFPRAAESVAVLVAAGADVNAPFTGPHAETPLHWAASSDDVGVLDALLDRGADIEAPGSVIGGGTPLADAVAFGQWQAARRLVERGARQNLWQAAALGSMDVIARRFAEVPRPTGDEITTAFWCACHGGQRTSSEYLLDRKADINWVGFDRLTPLDAARRSGANDLADWLRSRGAMSAAAPR